MSDLPGLPAIDGDTTPTPPPTMPEPPAEQPTTVPGALRACAQWLHAYDTWATQLFTQAGADEDVKAIAQGTEVQDFLTNLAQWFEDRPQLAEMTRGQIGL